MTECVAPRARKGREASEPRPRHTAASRSFAPDGQHELAAHVVKQAPHAEIICVPCARRPCMVYP
jgi:hypothetical protein